MELPNIREAHEKHLQSKIKEATLQNNLRASSIGWACDAYHVYALTKPKPPHDTGLQAIFDEGNIQEAAIENSLREMGFEVEGKQREFRYEKPLITAHIDGMLRSPGGEWYPYDAKTISPWAFDGVNSAEDLMHSKQVWHRQYPVQILLYMLNTNSPFGCLVFKNKQTGRLKDIWFSFEEHIEWLSEAIKRGERVYEAKENGSKGETTSDFELCNQCPWRKDCLPDLLADGGINLLESPELIELLEAREKVKEPKKEFGQLDTRVKALLKEITVGEKIAGSFMIKITEKETPGHVVKAGTRRTINIVKMT